MEIQIAALSAAQHDIRRTGISASEIAALFDQSPYITAFDVWHAKQDGYVPSEPSDEQYQGQILEGIAAHLVERAERAAGLEFSVEQPGTVIHPEEKLVIATPDRIVRYANGRVLLREIKTSGRFTMNGYGPSGEDAATGVPRGYYLQLQWQMLATGIEEGEIVLYVDREIRRYPARFDDMLCDMLLSTAKKFWAEHVEAGVRPSMEGARSAGEWLAAKYPTVNRPKPYEPTPEELAECEVFLTHHEAEKAAKEAKENARLRVIEIAADYPGIVTPRGTIGVKRNANGAHVVTAPRSSSKKAALVAA